MDQEYRYPLTRHCLRNGALTLPRTMLGLFPEEGVIAAVDTRRDLELELEATGPRTVAGLDEFFAVHDLDVNDEILIRPLEDGRFAFTPLPRPRKPDYARPGAVAALLDELAEAELAANEVEIRALYPHLPGDFDLRGLLEADDRFVFFEARWHARAALERRLDEDEAQRRAPRARAGSGAQSAAAPLGAQAAVPQPPGPAPQDRPGPERGHADAVGPAGVPGAGEARQGALWQSTWQDAWQPGEPTPWREVGRGAPEPEEADRRDAAMSSGDVAERESVAPPDGAQTGAADGDVPASGSPPSVRERRAPPRQSSVFPGDAALMRDDEDDDEIDLERVGRAREMLQAFGFRVEALGQGQLMVHAELGRRGYTALVSALGYGQRLDWAALLARRRETGARYLAVFGDHRDLQRLQAPAELARATLWSWEGLQRARTLRQSVPVSPFDLELHFEREGLFGHGLERFEKNVATLVAERGAFSEVLTRLAGLKAPTVFLLEDLAGGGTLSRDLVLKVLERLSEAPFHLVARVGQGEFCLRLPVGDGLANLVDYASSLRGRLPSRSRERLTGLGEPEWLQAEGRADEVSVGDDDLAPVDEAGAPTDDEVDS